MIRLGAGVIWNVALPRFGYQTDVEKAGYVMADAHKRDKAAWELAQSENSLWDAFKGYHHADQYGGMLFGSAFVYRFIGGNIHQPLQIIVITSAVSALAVLFTWVFAIRVWGASVAGLAAWIVALFPDAILLGSSQMREAIMMSLTMLAFYGLIRLLQDPSKTAGFMIVASILIAFPLSPPFCLFLIGMLGIFPFFVNDEGWIKKRRKWVSLIVLILLGLTVIMIFGSRILPEVASNPLIILQRWMSQAGRWQAYYAENASGWMQKIFRSTPDWSHTWLLLSYGIVRPFLPAALFDSAATIWRTIAVWRSLGWALLLPFLIVAPILVWNRESWRSTIMGLIVPVWVGLFLSSFRGGGDQWDNPRYRIIWIGLQATITAWVWVTQRQEGSAGLRRILISTLLFLVWWVPWYLRRVTAFKWPIQDVFLTLGLGILSVLIYIWIDFIYEKKRNS
jgi:hypothetical protein